MPDKPLSEMTDEELRERSLHFHRLGLEAMRDGGGFYSLRYYTQTSDRFKTELSRRAREEGDHDEG